MYYIRLNNGRRWKVREAVSLNAALDAIAEAHVSGSIGQTDILDETLCGGIRRVMADVVQVNSDNTERQPYTQAY